MQRILFSIFILVYCFFPVNLMSSNFEITEVVYSAEYPGDCTAPPAHAGAFTIYDRGVYLWIDWYGYEAGKVYRYEWYNPSGSMVKTYENSRDYNSNGCSWGGIRSQEILDNGAGIWTIKFFYDNILYYTGTFTFEDPGNFEYMSYKPASFQNGNGMLIAIHSSSYNPVSYYHFFKDMADSYGVVLFVPYFNETEWSSYNRVFTSNFRADTHLQNLIDTAASETGADKTKLYLYGQSAGGQFVHRYLLSHPENIFRIVISSPGWWTFPRQDWAFAYGIGDSSVIPDDIRFDLFKVNSVKKKVIIGELDTKRDESVFQSEMADLQGLNRLQRATHWVNRMSLFSIDNNLNHTIRYEIIPGAEHVTVRAESKQEIENFLFHDYQEPDVIGTIQINNDADTTDSPGVILNIRCKAANGAGKVAISTSAVDDTYENYQEVVWSGTAGGVQATAIPYNFNDENEGNKFIFCRIKDKNGNLSDVCGDTIVLMNSSITVTSPNGNESWSPGSSRAITWAAAGTVGNVKIDYSTNHGTAWSTIVSSTANDGTHTWIVPGSVSTDCLIRISETDGMPSDISDGVFSINIPIYHGNDFTGNNKADIAVYRSSNGYWYVRGGFPVRWGIQAGDIPVPGDYNGDGTTDIAVYRNSNGYWYIRGVGNYQWGIQAGDIPVPGDYNKDGKTDIAVYRPSNGYWYIKGVGNYQWGIQPGDIPVPGDYNGDNQTDIAVYRPSNGYWYIRGIGNYMWGIQSGDIPVPGDYDGNGTSDIAIYRHSNGYWYIRGGTYVRWGIRFEDIPVQADYNGDGRTDIAVFRPSTGTWYIKGIGSYIWGRKGGDIPLTRVSN